MTKTFVIAELGSCHNNDLAEAKHLIEVAKECGADAAKFQYWSSAKRMAYRRHAPHYEAAYAQFQMPIEWLLQLKEHADVVGIEFMCSTFLPEDVAVIAPLVKTLKIASFEANDPQHLVAHIKPLNEGHRVIVSLGLDAQSGPVQEFLIQRSNLPFSGAEKVFFLRCVSAYPAPIEELQLVRLQRRHWDTVLSGLSDHSIPTMTLTGALAVAAGATIVERHMRGAQTPVTNPDFPHAMRSGLFSVYVDNIRFAELAVGEIREAAVEQPLRALRVRE